MVVCPYRPVRLQIMFVLVRQEPDGITDVLVALR